MAIALGVTAGIPRRIAEAGAAARAVAVKVFYPRHASKVEGRGRQQAQPRKDYLTEADGPVAVRSLRQLELPFFATSSSFVNKPARGLVLRGRVRPSLQGCLLEAEAETRTTLENHLSNELGHPVRVHLLRAESEEEPGFELFVADAMREGTGEASLMASVASLAVVLAFVSQLGSAFLLKVGGAGAMVMASGSTLPLGMLLGLLAFSECVRAVTIRGLGGTCKPPLFLPSPQLGVLGTFPTGKEAPLSSRTSALLAALAGPVALAAGSALLIAYSALSGAAADITLGAHLSVAWPLLALPQHCSALLWAGAHGLLMAGLMLLPQSPAGQAAWQSLIGRQSAEQVSDFAAYFYPLLGIVCSSATGPGWFLLPLWWAGLLFNAAPTETQPALEEVSEVHPALRAASGAMLVMAALALAPLPLNELVPGLFPVH